jgi:hypothetical protein
MVFQCCGDAALPVSVLWPVLPGPLAASPPFEKKISTAIWRKHNAISNFSKIPQLSRLFLSFLC